MKAADYATAHNLTSEDVIKRISAGEIPGRVENGVWYVHDVRPDAPETPEQALPVYLETGVEGFLGFLAILTIIASLIAGAIFSFATVQDPRLAFIETTVFTPIGLAIGASGVLTGAAFLAASRIIKLLRFIAAMLDRTEQRKNFRW